MMDVIFVAITDIVVFGRGDGSQVEDKQLNQKNQKVMLDSRYEQERKSVYLEIKKNI